MSTRTLAEQARRVATLVALRRALDAEIAAERADHTARCLAAYAEEGTPRWDVRAEPGAPIAASFTIPVPRARTLVADPGALTAWARVEHPELVEVVHLPAVPARIEERLVGKSVSAYLDRLVRAPGGQAVDPDTGEAVAGVLVEADAPRSTSLRYPAGGDEALLSRWRDGLAPEMASAVLPEIGPAGGSR